MPLDHEPLLARHRPSSENSDDRAAEEESLLGRAVCRPAHCSRYHFWREVGLLIWAIAATLAVLILTTILARGWDQNSQDGKDGYGAKRNLIFMVSDGMGPASLSMTRSFRQYGSGLPADDVLVLDRHFIGSSRTRSTDSLITDSAAGATAFSCSLKSYNGAISMLPDYTPCGTVLEAAKKAGYVTGLVVTTDITDATPACFAAHALSRSMGDSIAAQEVGEHPLGRVVDIMLGGGRCHFLPNYTAGSCRQDDRDIIKLAEETYGWNYISDKAGFDALKLGNDVKLPLLGLFAETNIPYEIDRRNMKDTYPSLDEMAQTALNAMDAVTKGSDKGFFLMIEGSRIDHAGHNNDPAAQVHEVLAYDKAFASVLTFLEESEADGVVVSTSDHETGGLSIARQLNSTYSFKWDPGALVNVSQSSEHLASELRKHFTSGNSGRSMDDLKQYISEFILRKGLGIKDATNTEIQLVADHHDASMNILADMVSRRAQIGWSTHGHSAVDVNVYGSIGSGVLEGNHENTEIGEFLHNYLDVDVDAITKELNEKIRYLNPYYSNTYGGPFPTEEDMLVALSQHINLDGDL